MADLSKPQCTMSNYNGTKAISAVMFALTFIAIILIIGAFILFMESVPEGAVTCLITAIALFLGRGVMNGFRSVVAAAETYLEIEEGKTKTE